MYETILSWCWRSRLWQRYHHIRYAGTFNCESLVLKQYGGDEAQRLRWALLHRYKRVILSNEVSRNDTEKKTSIVLDGNLIKKLSGNDVMCARVHCGSELEFKPHYMMVILCNDVPTITPFDDALDGRERVLEYKKRFVLEPKNEFELSLDPNLKRELETDLFKECFILMLILEHAEYLNSGSVDIEPVEVIKAKREWSVQDGTPLEKFLERFEFTNSDLDYVETAIISKWFGTIESNMSFNRFARTVTKQDLVFDSMMKSVKGKKTRVWVGVKILPADTEELGF